MVRFQPRHGQSAFGSKGQPPPDYFSRRVQWKILTLVFLFMAVLMLMTEARKAKNWEWMWRLGGQREPSADAERAEVNHTGVRAQGPLDTRPPQPPPLGDSGSGPIITGPDTGMAGREETDRLLPQSLDAAQRSGWKAVLSRLSTPRRQLVWVALDHYWQGQPLSDDLATRWLEVVEKLDTGWNAYLTDARQAVDDDQGELTEPQRVLCRQVLETSRARWQRQHDALEALADQASWTTAQRRELDNVQKQLDAIALARIEDNTVLRSDDYEAWYRLWGKLRRTGASELARAEGPVSFVQLFSQPDEYRGRLVKIAGSVRLAYRMKSPKNPFGIDEYVVLWIRPADGATSPAVVYCLDLPPGFPDIGQRGADGQGTLMNEDVECSSFFFKRWVYASQGGPNLAPLLLGKITAWDAARSAARSNKSSRPPTWLVWLVICSAASLGTVIAVWVYWNSRRRAALLAGEDESPAVLPEFDQAPVRGSVGSTLQQLADQEGHSSQKPRPGSSDGNNI